MLLRAVESKIAGKNTRELTRMLDTGHPIAYLCLMLPDGNLIRRLRKASHEGLAAFARRVGVDAGQLSRVERGTRLHASYGWLLKVANGLGVPIEAIARDDESAVA